MYFFILSFVFRSLFICFVRSLCLYFVSSFFRYFVRACITSLVLPLCVSSFRYIIISFQFLFSLVIS